MNVTVDYPSVLLKPLLVKAIGNLETRTENRRRDGRFAEIKQKEQYATYGWFKRFCCDFKSNQVDVGFDIWSNDWIIFSNQNLLNSWTSLVTTCSHTDTVRLDGNDLNIIHEWATAE